MRQFADLVGVSNPYMSQIDRGLRAPSEQALIEAYEAFVVVGARPRRG